MRVCIAEKPSVAKEIAHILGANTKKNGYFEGNNYIVTYTFGHLCSLNEPSDYKPYWKKWDLNNLPMLPEKFDTKVVNDNGIVKQFNVIKSLLNNASLVINCGDAGQEGELIQRWVLNKSNYKGEVKRLWISSLTPEAIKEGFNNLYPAEKYDNLFYAGYSRAIGDWLLGINATRLYTLKYGANKQVLSVGRVQTPTLSMVVERHLEIEKFKPTPYWELQTTYRDTVFSYEEGRFNNQEEGSKISNEIAQEEFEIIGVSKKKGTEYAPKLFDLTGLQVYCNSKFGFSADETLKLVQQLYERKLVTYPRVDTTFLPSDVYPKVKTILSKLSKYSSFTEKLLDKPIRKTTKVFNDKKVTDHHAIIPTGIESQLSENLFKVYDIITRRFIAVFYDDSKISNTLVQGKILNYVFKTTGKQVLEKGWRVLFETSKTDSKEEKTLPEFNKGEKGPHSPSFSEKFTKPPKNFSEATLLRAMETAGKFVDDDEMRDLMKENGIGRPSTRASIIETLFRRKYLIRNKKQILPTDTGIQLIKTIDNKLLKSAELTGLWEKQLRDIEKGSFKAGVFIKNMKKMVDDLVYEVRLNNKTISFTDNSIKPVKPKVAKSKTELINSECPKCKAGRILKGKTAFGCSNYKTCDFKLPFKIHDKKITEKQFHALITKSKTPKIKGFIINSEKTEGILKLDDSFKINFEPSEAKPKVFTCPKCKKGKLLKGKTGYGCSEFRKTCDFVVMFNDIECSEELNAKVYKMIKEKV